MTGQYTRGPLSRGRVPMSVATFAGVEEACAAAGFVVRGAFHCAAADAVPRVAGAPAASLVLVGAAGRDGFAAFRAAPEWGQDGDALDRFTERVLGAVARRIGASALYPHHGPPWLPFQRWARRAGPVHRSPLGLLIHGRFGLWHAYRGALAFAAPLPGLPDPDPDPDASPCLACDARPCLSACPVNAFGAAGYDVAACAGHLRSRAGEGCLLQGCRARGACPVGAAHRYAPDQIRFHMHAFARGLGATAPPRERGRGDGAACGGPAHRLLPGERGEE